MNGARRREILLVDRTAIRTLAEPQPLNGRFLEHGPQWFCFSGRSVSSPYAERRISPENHGLIRRLAVRRVDGHEDLGRLLPPNTTHEKSELVLRCRLQ